VSSGQPRSRLGAGDAPRKRPGPIDVVLLDEGVGNLPRLGLPAVPGDQGPLGGHGTLLAAALLTWLPQLNVHSVRLGATPWDSLARAFTLCPKVILMAWDYRGAPWPSGWNPGNVAAALVATRAPMLPACLRRLVVPVPADVPAVTLRHPATGVVHGGVSLRAALWAGRVAQRLEHHGVTADAGGDQLAAPRPTPPTRRLTLP
jgi:hypothetical protein